MRRGRLVTRDYDASVPFSVQEVYEALTVQYPERFKPHQPYVTTSVYMDSEDGTISIRLRHE